MGRGEWGSGGIVCLLYVGHSKSERTVMQDEGRSAHLQNLLNVLDIEQARAYHTVCMGLTCMYGHDAQYSYNWYSVHAFVRSNLVPTYRGKGSARY